MRTVNVIVTMGLEESEPPERAVLIVRNTLDNMYTPLLEAHPCTVALAEGSPEP